MLSSRNERGPTELGLESNTCRYRATAMMISSIIAGVKNGVTNSAGRTRVARSFMSTLQSDNVSTAKPTDHTMPQANGVASSRLTGESISPHVKKAEYAVRGDIVVRAGEIAKELKAGKKYPFSDIVMCNIGNPQALGQKPVTFYRQVLAICDYPQVQQAAQQLQTALERVC